MQGLKSQKAYGSIFIMGSELRIGRFLGRSFPMDAKRQAACYSSNVSIGDRVLLPNAALTPTFPWGTTLCRFDPCF